MMHIAKWERDDDYRRKVTSAMRYEFEETWVEKNAKDYFSCRQIEALKIPETPDEYCNTDDNIRDAFIEMIGFFRSWDELQKTNLKASDLSALYRKIRHKYCDKGVYPYNENGTFLKYRQQRKLSLSGHPKDFSVYGSDVYKKAQAKESALPTYYPPIQDTRGYNKPYCSGNYCQDPATCKREGCKHRL